MKRLSPEIRKQMILKAAVVAFHDHGLLETTNEQIAEHCEVQTSVGTIRSYFRTREELIIAVHEAPQCPEKLKQEIEGHGYVDSTSRA